MMRDFLDFIYYHVDVYYLQRAGIAFSIILGQIIFIWIIWRIFKHINYKIDHASGKEKIKPLTIKHIKLLTAKQLINLIHVILRIFKYSITIILLFITVPVIFSLFPETRDFSSVLFGYILTPLKSIAIGIVRYIPNLFTILIIVFITRYVLKGLKFIAN
jgi:hypothetical protein